jgi:hypothetical protein
MLKTLENEIIPSHPNAPTQNDDYIHEEGDM